MYLSIWMALPLCLKETNPEVYQTCNLSIYYFDVAMLLLIHHACMINPLVMLLIFVSGGVVITGTWLYIFFSRRRC